MPVRTGRDSFVLCAAGMARSVGPTVTSCEAVKAKVTIQDVIQSNGDIMAVDKVLLPV